MNNSLINTDIIIRVANALGKLNERVVFVGGATMGLYINDPAADDLRPTNDIDISLSVATIIELEQLREALNA